MGHRIRKILLVVFITLFIWVWADLELDEYIEKTAVVRIVLPSSHIWAYFDNYNLLSTIRIRLRGPAGKIAKFRRQIEAGEEKLEIQLDTEKLGINIIGDPTIYLLPILKTDEGIRKHGLTIETCEPESLKLHVRKLVEQKLTVEVIGEDAFRIDAEQIVPPQVNMYVPEQWPPDKYKAYVQLTAQQIAQARERAIKAKAYIELVEGVPGQQRLSDQDIIIKLPSVAQQLKEWAIAKTNIGFVFSESMQGKYTVEIINLSDIIGSFKIKATEQAAREYEKMDFHIILEIHDGDLAQPDEISRRVKYNFPPQYVCTDEIKAFSPPQPPNARFRLKPVSDQ
ncbi:MAG: hypothetical protein ABIG61_14525 [Planctomycetota bacterium]